MGVSTVTMDATDATHVHMIINYLPCTGNIMSCHCCQEYCSRALTTCDIFLYTVNNNNILLQLTVQLLMCPVYWDVH